MTIFGGWLIVGKSQMSGISAIQVYVACFSALCIFVLPFGIL